VAVSASRTIASYSADGELRWFWQLQADNQSPLEIAFDGRGNLATAFPLQSPGFRVVKFSRRGVVLWKSDYVNPVANPRDETGEVIHVRVDAAGNVYAATDGAADCFWRGTGSERELKCITVPMIAKFDVNGEPCWVSRLTASDDFDGYAELRGLAIDPVGRTYMSGRLVPLNDVTRQGFVVKLDPYGSQVWGGEYTHPSLRELFLAHLDSAEWNRVVVAGTLYDRAAQESDHLVLKFATPRSSRISVVKYPASQTVAAGQRVTFGVAAVPRPLTYVWRFNGMPMSTETGSTLTIVAKPSRAGDYSVTITDQNGGSLVTPEARLTVTAP
jgi:hypothetical protein